MREGASYSTDLGLGWTPQGGPQAWNGTTANDLYTCLNACS
jgi:hypothetical protein